MGEMKIAGLVKHFILGLILVVATTECFVEQAPTRYVLSSKEDIEKWKEYDRMPRSCTVFLFTRTVEDVPEDLGIEYSHWAIVVEFEDGTWRTAEGMYNEELNIHPHYTKERPREAGAYRELGKLEALSPFELSKRTMEVSMNGRPYMLGILNCQEWAKELANRLGEHIYKNIERAKTIAEENPILAKVAMTYFASTHSQLRLVKSMRTVKKCLIKNRKQLFDALLFSAVVHMNMKM